MLSGAHYSQNYAGIIHPTLLGGQTYLEIEFYHRGKLIFYLLGIFSFFFWRGRGVWKPTRVTFSEVEPRAWSLEP